MDVERPALESVEKVTDIDGSEILITINEENEDSDNEENSTKKKKTVEEDYQYLLTTDVYVLLLRWSN
jgi:hypothetical protein